MPEKKTAILPLERCLVTAILCAWMLMPAAAQQKTPDLTDRSLEDLMNIQVTSVSKKEQKTLANGLSGLRHHAEDIRRSGSTNIPDLLRMVPGVEVAQIGANTWAVSAAD